MDGLFAESRTEGGQTVGLSPGQKPQDGTAGLALVGIGMGHGHGANLCLGLRNWSRFTRKIGGFHVKVS